MYLIDGFYEVRPSALGWLITDPLTRHMTSVDGVTIFTIRRGILIEGETRRTPMWQTAFRDGQKDRQFAYFVNLLGKGFTEYIQELTGVQFPRQSLILKGSFLTVLETATF